MDKKVVELLKEIAFIDPDASMTERAETAMRAQVILQENGYSDWVKNEIQKNIDNIIGDTIEHENFGKTNIEGTILDLKVCWPVQRSQLERLKKGDRIIVHWNPRSPAARKGETVTMTRIWGVNNLGEVIVRKHDNLFFSIDKYLKGESYAKTVVLITEE